MPPSKDLLHAGVLRSIEEDFRQELKSLAGPIDEDLIAYRRRRCRRFNHILRKDIQAFSNTSDDGRWFIEVHYRVSQTEVCTHLTQTVLSYTPGRHSGQRARICIRLKTFRLEGLTGTARQHVRA